MRFCTATTPSFSSVVHRKFWAMRNIWLTRGSGEFCNSTNSIRNSRELNSYYSGNDTHQRLVVDGIHVLLVDIDAQHIIAALLEAQSCADAQTPNAEKCHLLDKSHGTESVKKGKYENEKIRIKICTRASATLQICALQNTLRSLLQSSLHFRTATVPEASLSTNTHTRTHTHTHTHHLLAAFRRQSPAAAKVATNDEVLFHPALRWHLGLLPNRHL